MHSVSSSNNDLNDGVFKEQILLKLGIWRTTFYLRVINFGKGLPTSVLAKLADEPVSSKSPGSGIGIYSAFELLKAAEHELAIHTKEGVEHRLRLYSEINPLLEQ